MEIFDIIESIAATASRNEKQAILEAHKDNELLKRVLYYTYESSKNYYIRKFPAVDDDKQLNTETFIALEDIFQLLDDLNNRVITGHAALHEVMLCYNGLSHKNAKLFARIIERDLRAGFSAGTTNKVFPGLVTDFPCMLAQPVESLDDLTYPVMGQLKKDGVRAFAVPGVDKSYSFFSRNGKFIDVGEQTTDAMKQISDGYVFDGELTVVGMDRKRSSGIINKAIKGTISKKEQDLIRYSVWDVVPVEAFWKGYYDELTCQERYQMLNAMEYAGFPDFVDLIDCWVIHNAEAARASFARKLAEGEEGLILKTMDGPWESKRSKHWVKVKGEYEAEFVIVGWEFGEGKNETKLGNLICESSDGKIRFGVGSGLNDIHRETLTDAVIGKIVSIKFNDIISNEKTDKLSLFLPIFLGIREDKDEANSYEEVMKIAGKK